MTLDSTSPTAVRILPDDNPEWSATMATTTPIPYQDDDEYRTSYLAALDTNLRVRLRARGGDAVPWHDQSGTITDPWGHGERLRFTTDAGVAYDLDLCWPAPEDVIVAIKLVW